MAVQEIPSLPPIMTIINGKYSYLTTYKIAWDKELRQPRRTKGQNRTVGKIIGGGAEGVVEWTADFLLEHPELQSFTTTRKLKGSKGKKRVFEFVFEPYDEMISLTKAVNLLRLSAGATWTLDNVIANTPLTKALEAVFSRYNRHKKLLSIAYYMYLTSNSATWLYEDYAKKHRLPFQKPLDAAQISRLFSGISADEIDRFLKKLNKLQTEIEQNKNVGKVNTYYALDSTSISTYSDSITKAQWGHNKDGDALKQINLLMLVNQETGMPLFYQTYTGNTPDVSTIRTIISEFTRTGMNRDAIIVADRGYGLISSIHQCLLYNLNFIFNTRTSLSFTRQLIAEHLETLNDFCSYNSKIQCYCVSQKYTWYYPTLDKTKTGRATKTSTDIYIHIYLDKHIRSECENDLLKKTILPLLEKLRLGKELDKDEQELKQKFLKDDGNNNFSTNNQAKTEYLLDKGIRILVSNTVDDAVECWRAYYEREVIEDSFKVIKQRIGGSRYRTAKDESTEGKAFVMFLACSIGMMFRQKINHATLKGMLLPYDSDTKLLSKLDSIEQTVFKDGAYYSSVTGVQKKILEALEIPLPTSEPYGKLKKEEEEPDEDDNLKSVEELEMILNTLEDKSNFQKKAD